LCEEFTGNCPLSRICRWVGLDFWHEEIADVGRAGGVVGGFYSSAEFCF
jgi:hypothetical protein